VHDADEGDWQFLTGDRFHVADGLIVSQGSVVRRDATPERTLGVRNREPPDCASAAGSGQRVSGQSRPQGCAPVQPSPGGRVRTTRTPRYSRASPGGCQSRNAERARSGA
jgi:hypothetical protein